MKAEAPEAHGSPALATGLGLCLAGHPGLAWICAQNSQTMSFMRAGTGSPYAWCLAQSRILIKHVWPRNGSRPAHMRLGSVCMYVCVHACTSNIDRCLCCVPLSLDAECDFKSRHLES